MCLGGGAIATGGNDGQLGLQGGVAQQPAPYEQRNTTLYGSDWVGMNDPAPAKVAEPPVQAAATVPVPAVVTAAPLTPPVNAPAVDPGISDGTEEPAQLARFGERYYRSRMRSPSVAKFGPVGGYSGKGSTLGTT